MDRATSLTRIGISALWLAGFACAAVAQTSSGGDSDGGAGGCVPEPKYSSTTPTNIADTEIKEHVWVHSGPKPNESASGEQDSGRYRRASTSANGGVGANLDLYLWAEDEDEVSIMGQARRTVKHTMWTQCNPKPNHVTPDFGDSVFTISSRAELTLQATSPQNDGGRAISAVLKADLPTGQTLRVEVDSSDESAPTNEREVTVTLNGGVSSNTEVSAGTSTEEALQAEISRASKLKLGATITYRRKTTWTTNQAIAITENASVSTSDSVRPKCHKNAIERFESADVSATASLGSPWAGEYEEINLRSSVKTITNIQKQPGATCSVKGKETPPTPVTTPRDSNIPTTTQDGPTTGSGTQTRATTATPPDGTTTTGSAQFQVHSTEPSTSYLRVAPGTPLVAFAGNVTATSIDVDMPPATYTFGPTAPIELPAGNWWLTVPFQPLAAGIAFVELSFHEEFQGDDPARTVIEVVNEPFSMSGWTAGQHLGESQFSPTFDGFGAGSRIWIESLWSEAEQLGTPSVSYEVTAGGDEGWWFEPSVAFDESEAAWYLTMAPKGKTTLDVHVSFDGHTVVVPVDWAEGAPVDGLEIPAEVDENDDESAPDQTDDGSTEE